MSDATPAALLTRQKRPYCEFTQGGEIKVRDYDGRVLVRLTLAAAEDLAFDLAAAARTGRAWAASEDSQPKASGKAGDDRV